MPLQNSAILDPSFLNRITFFYFGPNILLNFIDSDTILKDVGYKSYEFLKFFNLDPPLTSSLN